MNIEIEICNLESDAGEKQKRLKALQLSLQALAGKIEGVAPHHENSWLLLSEDALPFLGLAIDRAERNQLPYKVRFVDLNSEEAVLWSRSF